MRRVSGYNLDEFVGDKPFDLSKIVVGSEGTLCTLVEAKLKLVELPRCTGVVACHFETLVEAMEANAIALETDPAAVELTDKILLDLTKGSIEHARRRSFLQKDPHALLFVEYYGESERELWRKMDDLEARLGEGELGYAFVKTVDPAEQKNMWELRKSRARLADGA